MLLLFGHPYSLAHRLVLLVLLDISFRRSSIPAVLSPISWRSSLSGMLRCTRTGLCVSPAKTSAQCTGVQVYRCTERIMQHLGRKRLEDKFLETINH